MPQPLGSLQDSLAVLFFKHHLKGRLHDKFYVNTKIVEPSSLAWRTSRSGPCVPGTLFPPLSTPLMSIYHPFSLTFRPILIHAHAGVWEWDIMTAQVKLPESTEIDINIGLRDNMIASRANTPCGVGKFFKLA